MAAIAVCAPSQSAASYPRPRRPIVSPTEGATATALPATRRLERARRRTTPTRLLTATALAAAVALAALLSANWVSLSTDGRYSLAWGAELLRGDLPGLEAPSVPTPHPLPIAGGALLSAAGAQAAADAYAFAAALGFVLLVYAAFRLGRALAGVPAGVVAALLVATRPRLDFFASRSFIDVPFAALVVLAAALVAEEPRRNARPALALLTLAGLLRPEAWGLSLLYGGWLLLDRSGAARRALARVRARRRGARAAAGSALAPEAPGSPTAISALALAAPGIWVALDLALTGNPLHSLQGTQEGAIALNRRIGLDELLPSLRDGIRGLAGTLPAMAGALFAAWALARRSRARLPGPLAAIGGRLQRLPAPRPPASSAVAVAAGLAAAGIAAFATLAVADLPLNDRYLVVPAIALLVLAAAALPHALRSPVAAAIAALALVPTALALPDDLEETRVQLDHAAGRSAGDADLEALAARPAVGAEAKRCPRLLAAGSGRATVAAQLELDPSEVAIARSPIPPRGAATFSTSDTVPARTPGTVRGGAWTFVSRC